jgi:hypothetical protein
VQSQYTHTAFFNKQNSSLSHNFTVWKQSTHLKGEADKNRHILYKTCSHIQDVLQ